MHTVQRLHPYLDTYVIVATQQKNTPRMMTTMSPMPTVGVPKRCMEASYMICATGSPPEAESPLSTASMLCTSSQQFRNSTQSNSNIDNLPKGARGQ